jgi:hypothetical protein
MLGHSHNGLSVRNRNWTLAGLGSNYSSKPYLDNLHRGYGWGRIIDLDDDFPSQASTAHLNFRREANEMAQSEKENRKTTYPLQWK